MFRELGINRAVFAAALNIVDSVPLQRRGRPGFVHSHKDRLLFLMAFLVSGTKGLKLMCFPRLVCPMAILRDLHEVAKSFLDPLTRNTIWFRHERADGLPLVSCVVDCTVVEINGPDLPFMQKDEYFSGKHKRHCLKKEVIVNVRSGTAAMVSAEYPGSVADIEVLRRHAADVNRMVGHTTMLADKGYRGDTNVPNCHVVNDAVEAEVVQRLVVERFFGRLKSLFMVFSRRWEFTGKYFSTYFNIACALTNLSILVSPLNQDDWEFNNNLLAKWEREEAERIRASQERTERRRVRRVVEREEMILGFLQRRII